MLIRCLGPVSVLQEDGQTTLSQSKRRIIAILTAAGPEGITADHFAEELWGEALPSSWEASVRQHMTRTRKVLGVGGISIHNSRYSLDLAIGDVDVWRLLAIGDVDIANEPEDLIQQLLSGEPFAGVEPSPLLQEQAEPINAARLQLIEAMQDFGDRWSAATLLSVRALVSRSHFRHDLLSAAAELHIRAEKGADAHRLLVDAERYLQGELDSGLAPKAAALLAELGTSIGGNEPKGAAPSDPVRGRIVGIVDTARDPGRIGRSDVTDQIAQSLQGAGSLVTGDSGAGKSGAVQAAILDAADHGHHVLWLRGQHGSPSAYGVFLSGLSSLALDLEPLLVDGGNELLRSRCWIAVSRRLQAEFPELPLCIVIDDAQWLDSHSQRLVINLASDQAPLAPQLVVVGRNDRSAHDWNDFSHELTNIGLTHIQVEDFTEEDLHALIGLHHPAATSKQRHDFALKLIEDRASLPAIAHELIRSADPATLAISDTDRTASSRKIWSNRVRPETQHVASIAAVAGMRFRVPTIVELSGLRVDAVVQATDELLDERLIVEGQLLDEYVFQHVLVHADFDGLLNRGERRRLHLSASHTAAESGDIHARATHLVEAGALVDNADVVDALLASANLFVASGSYREAADAFARARLYSDDELGVEDLLAFAAAVSSSGGDGWELRMQAFALAEQTRDYELCLQVALDGALRTEDATGQPRRVKMLERINATELSETKRAVHSSALARELGLLGKHDQATTLATEAVRLATTPNDRFAAWLGAWASCRTLPPNQWPELPADHDQVTDPELVSRLAQVECARALILGHDSIQTTARHFSDHHFTRSDPLRRWHACLVDCTLAFVSGRWDDYQRQADAAFQDAADHGVTAAFSTRIAQAFAPLWVSGQHGALLPQFDSAAPDVQMSILAQAAHAVTLAQHEDHLQRASVVIDELSAKADEFRSPFSHSAAALLASAPDSCISSDAKLHIGSILDPFRGMTVIAGANIGHFGPATWSLAKIAATPTEREALLQEACEESDGWNLTLWSVVCRRDLAALTDSSELLNEAKSLAEGTALTPLLDP